MGTRTVRLDEETERTLARLRKITGLSIFEVLKRGLIAYTEKAVEDSKRTPYQIYRQLDLGEGGYAVARARQAKASVRTAIQRKRAP
jgi:hypothetical protein